jgi:NADH-quinone oxidoreductase subunit C
VTESSKAMDASAVIDVLRETVPAASLEAAAAVDMETIYVDREHIVDVCRTLRDHPALQFALLVEETAADYFPAEPRFEIVYHLACVGAAYAGAGGPAPPRRLRLKVRLAGSDTHMPTMTTIYPTAGWLEREIFDLFGITFDGHQDLRRILMTDDWEGSPLRKDYPVQIRKETSSWSAVQLTPEEFAANVQAARDRAKGK